MRRTFTIEDIKKSKVAHLNGHVLKQSNSTTLKKQPAQRKSSKALRWLKTNLHYWAIEKKENLVEEYEFSEGRKYRSDWALPDHKILIEYEGGIFMDKSGHNSHTGIQRDIEKYKLANKLGFTVLRYTAINYKNVLSDLEEILKNE